MKNIFIPSDFSEASLNLILGFVKSFKNQKVNIVLFHTLALPDTLSDLLFISRDNQEILQLSGEFMKKCKLLEKCYKNQIASIQQTLIYGSSEVIFRQYLITYGIDYVVWQKGYKMKKLNNYSYDPTDLIENCGVKLIDMDKELYICNSSSVFVKQIAFFEN